jgi:arsenate reductase-like glutaredoxin family protein
MNTQESIKYSVEKAKEKYRYCDITYDEAIQYASEYFSNECLIHIAHQSADPAEEIMRMVIDHKQGHYKESNNYLDYKLLLLEDVK